MPRGILERAFPYYRRLDEGRRGKLVADLAAFASKDIAGLDGLVVTEEMRVLVAATAGLLVLELDIALFDHVTRVELRPTAYAADTGGEAAGHYESCGGQGVVQLSWRHVVDGLARPDGMHVGIHELAHALDHGLGGGLLSGHECADHWRRSLDQFPLRREREGQFMVTHVVPDVSGPELFAVASELFFERPMTVLRIDPLLFAELERIYRLDPRMFW